MEIAILVALAFGLAFFLTPLFKRLARSKGIVDEPNARKVHNSSTPLLGGAAVYLAFWSGVGILLLFNGGGEEILGLFLGSTLITFLGLYDDIKGLSYKAKFAGQFAAAFILLAYNIRIEFITFPFQEIVFLGTFMVPLTLLWVVGITNAVNLIDGVDGLAAGVSVIAGVVVFSLTWGEFPYITILVLILAGAALGFLPHNFYPARIFLGDAGSLFLGFMLAAFSIMGVAKQATLTTLIVPVLVFGLPIADTFFAIWRRYRSRRPLFQADKGHIHHRLMALGLTTRQTVVILYLISVYFGAAAIVFNRFPSIYIFLIPLIFALFLLGIKRLDTLKEILSEIPVQALSSKQQSDKKD